MVTNVREQLFANSCSGYLDPHSWLLVPGLLIASPITCLMAWVGAVAGAASAILLSPLWTSVSIKLLIFPSVITMMSISGLYFVIGVHSGGLLLLCSSSGFTQVGCCCCVRHRGSLRWVVVVVFVIGVHSGGFLLLCSSSGFTQVGGCVYNKRYIPHFNDFKAQKTIMSISGLCFVI